MLTSVRASIAALAFRPHHFILTRPFGVMLLLYSSTYLSANLIDTASSTANGTPASSTTSGLVKFGTVSTVNVSLALYKDSQFARIFGKAIGRTVPSASYAPFIVRDCLTIFASFNLPAMIAPNLPEPLDHSIGRMWTAQLAAPALVQPLGTPLHLLGLDLYNRIQPTPLLERMRKVWLDWPSASLARMCRVIPAFGIGGVANSSIRMNLMESFA